MSGTATYYVGNWYEVTNGAITKYYYFGSQRVAMKQGSTVTYLHGDHLGSTSVASTQTGTMASRQTYYAFGVPRTTEGILPTDYTFTGQRADSSAGLMYYGARYYDASLNRFIQPDMIVPGATNPQNLNRYSYVVNNPIRHTDPTGHCWGFASGLRGVPGYDTTCGNLDLALTIVQHPNATWDQKLVAGGYIFVEGAAHFTVVAGTAYIATEVVSAAAAVKAATEAGATISACSKAHCVEGAQVVLDNVGKFVEGAFSGSEQSMVESLIKELGLNFKGIELTSHEGAPPSYLGGAVGGGDPTIALTEAFFKASHAEQLRTLAEEWFHITQDVTSAAAGDIEAYEEAAKSFADSMIPR